MTSRDFCYWVQGLFELGDPKTLDARQTDLVKRHLAMVFIHEIDPSMGGPAEQQKLSEAHAGKVFEMQPDGSKKEVTDPARKQEIVETTLWHKSGVPHNCTWTCPGNPNFGVKPPKDPLDLPLRPSLSLFEPVQGVPDIKFNC